jgi:hypothetical protein
MHLFLAIKIEIDVCVDFLLRRLFQYVSNRIMYKQRTPAKRA